VGFDVRAVADAVTVAEALQRGDVRFGDREVDGDERGGGVGEFVHAIRGGGIWRGVGHGGERTAQRTCAGGFW
jgi:hypothetical protein